MKIIKILIYFVMKVLFVTFECEFYYGLVNFFHVNLRYKRKLTWTDTDRNLDFFAEIAPMILKTVLAEPVETSRHTKIFSVCARRRVSRGVRSLTGRFFAVYMENARRLRKILQISRRVSNVGSALWRRQRESHPTLLKSFLYVQTSNYSMDWVILTYRFF